MFDLETREFFVTRDVKFVEHVFPYVAVGSSLEQDAIQSPSDLIYSDDDVLEEPPLVAARHTAPRRSLSLVRLIINPYNKPRWISRLL